MTAVLGLALLLLGGCRQDMHDQPRYEPLEPSDFWADGQASRTPVEGTVARGLLRQDTLLYTGKQNNVHVNELPFPATREVLLRGQERYNVYCAPCHSRTGDGDGMIVRRGFRRPPSLHEERLRQAPLGHYFDVMSNGFGAMPDYAAQVPVNDRWAIAAYVRALQFSQYVPAAELPPAARQEIERQQKPLPPQPKTSSPQEGVDR